jgi:hypothetical protein
MVAAKGNNYALNRKWRPQYTEKQIEDICEELLDFAENDKSIFFVKFCRRKGFTKQWLLKMCDHHPLLALTYEFAKELMSAKIGDLCFNDKESGVNANFGKDNLFRYDKEWIAHMKWKADITKEPLMKEENKGLFNEWKEKQKNDVEYQEFLKWKEQQKNNA